MSKSTSININVSGGSVSIGDGANIGNIVENVQPGLQPRASSTLEPFDVFISYSQLDRGVVDRIALALARSGLKVWYDRNLDSSEAFISEINDRLASAPAVLVVWSKNSIASEWVLNEAEIARQRNVLLGVRIDGTFPPAPFLLRQAIDFAVPPEGDIFLPEPVSAGLTSILGPK